MTDVSPPNRPTIPSTSTPLVGRERELALLRAGLERGLAGARQVLLLAGEPGIGKTRTAEELASEAAARGALVLWGRCHEAEWTPPYWPWVQLLRAYAEHRSTDTLRAQLGTGAADIAQLVPEIAARLPDLPALPALAPEQVRFRAFDHVAAFLRRAAAAQPLVLILDDLHWADAPSLLLLEFVAREGGDAPLVLLGTYRDVELGRQHPLARTVAELARAGQSQRITLRGLTQADVGRLVAADGVAPTAELVAAISGETDGNPFFVHEVARLLASEAADGRSTRDGRPGGRLPIPQSVREAIGRRLDRLTPECNEVLATAAAIGREFGLVVLARASDLPRAHVLELLDEAEAAGVVEGVSAAVGLRRFSHSLIRETRYEELNTLRRVRLHRRIGLALETLYAADLDAHLPELAYHFAQAAPGGDVERAIDYARRAGDRAMALLAYEEAAAHDELALQVIELAEAPDEALRCELLLALGDAQNLVATDNAHPQARANYLRAAEIARRLGATERLARAALGAGGLDPGDSRGGLAQIALVEEALAALEPGDGEVKVRLLVRLAQDSFWTLPGAAGRARSLADEAVAMARRLDDCPGLASALLARQRFGWGPDNVEERLADLAEVMRLAEAAGAPFVYGHACGERWLSLMELGDIVEADRALDVHATVAGHLRMAQFQWGQAIGRAARTLFTGRFAEGESLLQRAHELWEGNPDQYTAQLFLLRREQGRLGELRDGARARYEQDPALPHTGWARFRHALLMWLDLETGDVGGARAAFDATAAGDFADVARDWSWLGVMAILAEVCAVLSDVDRAVPLYDLLLPYADRNLSGGYNGVFYGSGAYHVGLLATTLGRWEAAARHFEDAIAMNRRMGARPFVARAQHAYASMLAKRGLPGDGEQAHSLADSALATADELGMVRLAEETRALRVRLATLLTRDAGAAVRCSLTERELDVLRLLVAGKSNPEIAAALFVSRATARTHVGNILAKLGVHSRAEVVDYAHRHGLL